MTRHHEYGLEWELDPDPKKGQLGLLRENHYRMLFDPENRSTSLAEGDTWLDVGANIGAFAVRAAPFVRRVIAVEPDVDNMNWLHRNAQLNGVEWKIRFLKAAVVAGNNRIVPLALSNSFSSTHRLGFIRGRKTEEVPGVNIDEIVEKYGINKIKMDCEGTEAEILETMKYTSIEEIVFEYHFSFLGDYDWSRFNAILKGISHEGFTILKQPKKPSKTWHTIVWVKRL